MPKAEVTAPSVAFSAVTELLGFDHPYFLARLPAVGLEVSIVGTDRVATRWVMPEDLVAEIIWALTEHPDVNHVMCEPWRAR